MQQLGMSEADIAAAMAQLPDDEVEVWEWQWPAVRAFMLASTQWNYVSLPSAFGGSIARRVGLDYAGAKVAWEFGGVVLSPEEFDAVRTIEIGVLNGGKDNG